METNLDTLLAVAKKAALDAGEAIMELYDSSKYEMKDDGTPVTVADLRANEILLTHLATTHIPVLTEESEGIDTPYPELLWIIDPIDGTSGFIRSDGDFAVMIGLLKDGVPVLGVVYAPATQTLYFGVAGDGAYLEKNGETTRLALKEPHQPPRLVYSKNHPAKHFGMVADTLGAEKISRGGVGIKISVVIEGGGDFYYSWGELGEWDVCGPHAIYSALGGTVTDCLGNPFTYGESNHRIKNGIIFSHPNCFKEVAETIQKHAPEK